MKTQHSCKCGKSFDKPHELREHILLNRMNHISTSRLLPWLTDEKVAAHNQRADETNAMHGATFNPAIV